MKVNHPRRKRATLCSPLEIPSWSLPWRRGLLPTYQGGCCRFLCCAIAFVCVTKIASSFISFSCADASTSSCLDFARSRERRFCFWEGFKSVAHNKGSSAIPSTNALGMTELLNRCKEELYSTNLQSENTPSCCLVD